MLGLTIIYNNNNNNFFEENITEEAIFFSKMSKNYRIQKKIDDIIYVNTLIDARVIKNRQCYAFLL